MEGESKTPLVGVLALVFVFSPPFVFFPGTTLDLFQVDCRPCKYPSLAQSAMGVHIHSTYKIFLLGLSFAGNVDIRYTLVYPTSSLPSTALWRRLFD